MQTSLRPITPDIFKKTLGHFLLFDYDLLTNPIQVTFRPKPSQTLTKVSAFT